MLYKVLIVVRSESVFPEHVYVEGGGREWESLTEALNAFGPSGWEFAASQETADINSISGKTTKGNLIILINRTLTPEQERKWRETNLQLKRLLAERDAELRKVVANNTVDRDKVSERIRDQIVLITKELECFHDSGVPTCVGSGVN